MTPNPQSVRRVAAAAEAAAFLIARGFSTAPAVDEAGRPVGVVSRTDLLHNQTRPAVRPTRLAGSSRSAAPEGVAVQEVMTPVVLCVQPDTLVAEVVEKMLGLNVCRLFVVDDAGVLVGVVSASDVVRELGRELRASE